MSPPKQVRAISNTKRSLENDLKILPCVIKTCENDDYNQEYKIVYDFDDDDHVAMQKFQKDIIPDDEDNFFDVNENEYTNAALARSCKVVTGKRIDCDGYNGIVHEDTPVDTENVETQEVEEPSPFFVNDDEHDKYEEEDNIEDGDWFDDNEIEYYIDDDCW